MITVEAYSTLIKMDRLKHILILITIWVQFDSAYSQLTLEEIHELLKAFHEGCHKTFPIDETLIDEVNLGRFPNDRDLMCYTNCMLESMRFVRKGKLNTEIVKKNIQMFAPIQFQTEWLRGIDACKDVKDGENDPCERSYALIKCFRENNDKFWIP